MIPVCWLPAEHVLKIIIGQQKTLTMQTADWPGDNCWLLAALPTQTVGLPSQVAIGLITLKPDETTGQAAVDQITLVHPFHLEPTTTVISDSNIHREPVNWFGPQAIVLEKQWQNFVSHYRKTHDAGAAVPREAVPDHLAEPLLISDHYWESYATFVHDPEHTVAKQFKRFFDVK